MKKVIVINASPRGRNSTTGRLLQPLMNGMRSAGAEVKEIRLADYNINPCTSCYACWVTTPGSCIIKDDMPKIIEDYITSDLVVFGTPIHTYHMSSLLKTFIDRCLPLHTFKLVSKIEGITSLDTTIDKPSSMLLVANCGFPELDHFEPLVNYFKHFASRLGKIHLGEILQPMGELVKRPTLQPHLEAYFSSIWRIGRNIILNQAMLEEDLACMKKHWIVENKEIYNTLFNDFYSDKQSNYQKKQKTRTKQVVESENES